MSLTVRRYARRPQLMSAHALLIGALASLVFSVSASRGDDDWLSQAKREVLRQEYRFESQGDRLDAPNRAQDLRTFVTREGVLVEAREAKADTSRGGFTLAWRTSQWGRPGDMEPVEMVGFDVRDGEALLNLGALVERLSNDDRGLKQTFDVPAPPRSTRAAGPLVIEMSLRTDLRARLSESARTITWLTPDGHPRLTLSDLLVRDASGALLTSHFKVAPGVLSLVIEDSHAVYPLTVDPLLASASWIEDSNQAGAFFGLAVATAGDVNNDGFSDVIIGAYDYDNGQTNEGRVFLYLGDDKGLPATPSKTFESDQADAKFGYSVSTAGDLNGDGFDDFIVGAERYDGGHTDEGRVYVVLGAAVPSGILVDATLEANQANARFGYSVSNAGDIDKDGYDDIVIGAPLWDGGQTDEGALFVYRGDRNGIASGAPYHFESNQASAQLATAVSGAGDVNADGFDDVIAGAESYDTTRGADFGRVVGLYGSASGLPATASWIEDGFQAAAGFGESLGQAGDTNGDGYADIVIGAPQYDGSSQSMGRIYIYHGSSTGLDATAAHTRTGDQGGSQFGDTVGTAGDVNGDGYADVFVGANAYDIDGTANRGRMYVYHGSATGIAANANWTADGVQSNSGFGEKSATAGDIDGDGFSDLLVGAGGYDAGQTDEGRVYLYRGSGDGLATNAQATFNINDPSGSGTLGWSVASAGDVNGDGFSDVIIGAPFHRLGGRAWVFLGSLTGVSTTIHAELVPDVNDAQFGYGVSSAGDVNGDGYDDVVVGAPEYYYDAQRDFFAGRVFVYYGSGTGVDTVADYTDPRFQPSAILFDDEFGRVTCSAGDVNGDGFGDFYVGDNGNLYLGSATGPDDTTFFASSVLSCAGADVNRDGYSDLLIGNGDDASIYFGGPTGVDSNEDWTVFGNGFGSSVAFAGDVNGDGHVDLLVGEKPFPPASGVSARGYYGSATGPDTVQDWSVTGGGANSVVSGAGDIDGDGISDVVIGFPREFVSSSASAGRASLFFGAANGLSTVSARDILGSAVGGQLGYSVASAGDVNGDTFGDLIIGEQGRGDGFAYVYLGGGGDGMEFIPQNWKRLTDAPLALLGGGDDGTGFRIHARGRIPRGRSNVAMESQVARVDQALSTGAAVTGSFVNTGATDSTGASSTFTRTVSGLVAGNAYKWRMRFHSDDPLFPRTRWMSLPGNAAAEADIRMKCPASVWYQDTDGDTWGNAAVTQSVCLQPAGFVSRSGDCNDNNASINPGAAEACDGVDNNCAGGIDEGFVAPTGTPNLRATETGTRINLSWPALASSDRYDLVRGGLRVLVSTNGDFKTSTTLCLANDLAGTSVSDSALPGAGDGFYYVARGINCGQNGEYDSLSASQQGDRDAEINASASACP